MTKNLEAALEATRAIFGESTDPDTIKKFKAIEESLKAADDEIGQLTEKYGALAKEYRDTILGMPTKTPGEDPSAEPAAPKNFEQALADAFKSAQPKA